MPLSLFDGVGIFAGRKICGGDCRLCNHSAVEVGLGEDEPVFLLAQHDLEMAVLDAPLQSLAPGDDLGQFVDEASDRREQRLADDAGDGGGVELCSDHFVDDRDVRGG